MELSAGAGSAFAITAFLNCCLVGNAEQHKTEITRDSQPTLNLCALVILIIQCRNYIPKNLYITLVGGILDLLN